MVNDRAIARAAARADRNPTDAQKEAGNYRKGHVNIHGMDVTIENARGSRRSGKGKGGQKWSASMPAHYGYVRGTEGADGDHHDVYVGPMARSPLVFVIDQKNAETGKFDEHKSMLGFRTIQHATQTYAKAFSDGKGLRRLGGVTIMTVPQFKGWIKRAKTKHPLIMNHQHFDDGGAVAPNDDVTGTVAQPPSDGLTLEQLQQMQQSAPPTPQAPATHPDNGDGFTLDQLQQMHSQAPQDGFTLDQLQQQQQQALPQLSAGEAALVSGARSALPAAAAVGAAPIGAAVGGFLGAFASPFTFGASIPVGMFIGATGAAWLAGTVANKAQDMALGAVGLKDVADRYTAAAQQEHPYASLVGDLAPNLAAFRFDRAATKTARLLGAGIMGSQEAVSEEMQGNQSLDPVRIAMAAGAGSLMTQPTRLGRSIMAPGENFSSRVVPGRPDMQPAPGQTQEDVAGDKADASSSAPPRTALGASEMMPPPPQDVDIGNNNGERSARLYPKDQVAGAEPYEATVGPLDPGTVAALNEALGVDVGVQNGQEPATPGVQPVADQGATPPQPQTDAAVSQPGPGSEAASPPGVGAPGPQASEPPAANPPQQVGQQDIPPFLKRNADNSLPDITPDMFQTPDEPTPAAAAQDAKIENIASHVPPEAAAAATLNDRISAFVNDEKGSLNIQQAQQMLGTTGGAIPNVVRNLAATRAVGGDYRLVRPTSAASKVANSIEDSFQQLIGRRTATRNEINRIVHENIPADMAQDTGAQEAMYHAAEHGTVGALPADQRAFFEKNYQPFRDLATKMYQELRGWDPALASQLEDPNYMHRIAVGHDEISQTGADVSDPVVGYRTLSTKAPSLEAPKFFAIEDKNTGRRAVISPASNGFDLWVNGVAHRIPQSADTKIEQGGQVRVGNATFDVTRANTDEIEANARGRDNKPMEYVKNAGESIFRNFAELSDAYEHMQFLEKLKTNPDFLQWAIKRTDPNAKAMQKQGWRSTSMPQFQDYLMDPKIADVFDDYMKPGLGGAQSVESLRNLSRALTGTLFWNPLPHALNEAWHWFVDRGWDWLPASGEYKPLVKELMQSYKSVVTQDNLQQSIQRLGGRSIYGGIFAEGGDTFARNLARAFGRQVERSPSYWEPMFKSLGMSTPEFLQKIGAWSQQTMWSVGDAFYTNRVMARMRQTGMSLPDAITATERQMPNYRLGARLLGEGDFSRIAGMVLKDPMLVSFGRYHGAVLRALGHDIRPFIDKNASRDERVEAAGHMFALGLGLMVVYPMLNAAWQAVTGNPNAEAQPRGPLAPLRNMQALSKGTKDYSDVGRTIVTPSPLINTMLEMFNNRDFAGRPIIERGQVQRIVPHSLSDIPDSLANAGGVAVRGAEHAASQLVPPIGQAEQIAHRPDRSVLGGIRDQLLDIRNPSPAAVAYANKATAKNNQSLQQRFKRPQGLLEQGYHAVTGR